jgi:histidyl-tRNA synthetase
VYVGDVSESVRDTARSFAADLREQGLVVETDLSGRGLGDQLGYADRINATYTVIVGERDLDEGVVTVREMESGEEYTVDTDGVVEHLVEEA